MFKRRIHTRLLEWKHKKSNKPLLLRGARQVGKTTTVHHLGEAYATYLHLNLEKTADAAFFKNADRVDQILESILLEKNVRKVPGDTLLFIDEIQEVPEAIALLRYFYEELPEIDVIAAGSLLEFAIGDVPSFPVGRVELLSLHPMDFEEFLEAMGEELALEYYKKSPPPDIAFDKLMALFHDYMLIGGMPEIVAQYEAEGRQVAALSSTYSSIWDNYTMDIEKYGSNQSERQILRHIVSTAPYVRDRITFHGFGNSNYRSREVGEAFRKLDKAGLIRLIYPTSSTSSPVQLNYRRKPKIQFLDTGLLNYASGIQAAMIGVKDMNSLYKGYITNHMMTQELIAQSTRLGYIPPFWTRENANANAEVDLLIPHGQQLMPLEVKSGAKGRLRSLYEYMDRCEHSLGIRLLANKYSVEEVKTIKGKPFQLINVPYYAIARIEAYLDFMIRE